MKKKYSTYGPEIKAQALVLYSTGISYRAIAKLLKIPSHQTIRLWIDPKAAQQKAQYDAQYNQENKDRRAQYHAQYQTQYYQQNREHFLQCKAKYRQENPEKVRAAKAKRRASKRNATPPWFASQHQKQINALHAEAVLLQQETGTPYHVDHIYPITGKTMVNGKYQHTSCGLHVPWNLRVLPGSENCSKHCKMPDPAIDPPTAW